MKLQSISNADMLVVIFVHITASSVCPSVEAHRVLTKIASLILISALIGQFFEAVASGALPEATAVHYPRHPTRGALPAALQPLNLCKLHRTNRASLCST
jgi:hypothetical protein